MLSNPLVPIAVALLVATFACFAAGRTRTAGSSRGATRLQDLYLAGEVPYRAHGGKSSVLPYRLLVPEDHGAHAGNGAARRARAWPLILFLHGAGERGSDNRAQLKYFPAQMASPAYRRRYPAFILAPQCPPGRTWSALDLRDATPRFPARPAAEANAVLRILDAVLRSHPVDPDRVYLTGLSMGGFGCWDLAARFPERWAAVAPICGGGNVRAAAVMKDLPVWAFHGARDKVVDVELSRAMVHALKAAGGRPRYTEFPAVGHHSWMPAYGHRQFLPWLFRQKRKLLA
jgi:predicted peptidase